MRTDFPYMPGWRKNYEGNKPETKHSVLMFTTHGITEGEWLGDKWIQYRWSSPLKDAEVLYWMHLCDLERLEKEGDEESLEKEQPQVIDEADEIIRDAANRYLDSKFGAKAHLHSYIETFEAGVKWKESLCAENGQNIPD